ncbi:unnamed protein product [Ceutorhynchus assimilis]|uniref:Carboxylic ester hydrolase n=1 Tax=Ceutorhynchus assimilis TaxID=467358 RepID=A0A9N9QGP5_9CUCU|nr:unnamed protein product [Ceutorhynchus assimilis]
MRSKNVHNLFSIYCIILNINNLFAQKVTVTIPNGKLLGKTEITKTNHTFYSFSGVRYAQPPIGELRFKSPVPVEPWTDTYDATYEKNICYQAAGSATHLQNEDCLFLNIYTKEISDNLLPVMVFIHGGGFVIGFSGRTGNYGPDFFMEHDVVLVTLNYRLGPFGFSSTNDLVIPGNAGLKDQTLALKWIQQNIKYFGGDPSKVTIFGQSAGAGSVSYHLLSPKSSGLFRGAILESGSALSAWAYQPYQRDYTFKTANLINGNFTSNSSEDLLQFMLNASASDINAASRKIYNLERPGDKQLQHGFHYAPVYEPEHDDAFLTKSIFESMKNGEINKVPTIIGMNNEECIGQYNSKFKDVTDAFDNNQTLLLPINMHLQKPESKNAVIESIQNFYNISGNRTFREQLPGAIRYLTDQCFARSIIKQAELQSKFTDVYFYVMSYDGVMGNFAGKVEGTGSVTHNEELNYFYPRTIKSIGENTDLELFPESDRLTHYRLIKLWVNFATHLNPTPEVDELFQNLAWPKVDYSDETLEYLDINENLSVKTNPRWEMYTLWNELYKYAVPPYDGF